MSATSLVVAAYGAFWAAVVVYVVGLSRRHARLRADLDELRRKIDAPCKT